MLRRQGQNTSHQSRIARPYVPPHPVRASAPLFRDPHATAAEHNARSHLLSRLPGELLLQIMDYLEPASISCLRRARRAFLRLFCSPSFSHMHDEEGFFEQGPWTAQKMPSGGDWLSTARLINRDMFCVKRHLGWLRAAFRHTSHHLHCSGFNRDHSITLFSAKERDIDRSKRVCIGLEGSIRLCQHKCIRVEDIVKDEDGIRKFICHHPSHVPTHHEKLMLWRAPLRLTLEMDPSYGRRARLRARDIPERACGAVCYAQWRLRRGLDAVAGPVSYNWFSAIDPASHALALNRKMHGLTWCDTRGCAIYHGYLRERMVRGQRLDAMCKDGCEVGKASGTAKGEGMPMGSIRVLGLAKGTSWAEESDEVTGAHGGF